MTQKNEGTTQVVRPDSGSHWYKVDDNGVEAFHEVPYAGKRGKDGETRKTTIRDARKEGALPSVTNILGVLHKEFLVAYKVNQAILASLTLPRIKDESDDAFAKRVVTDSKEHAASAARLGSRLHDVGAAVLTGSEDGLPLEGEMIEGQGLIETATPLINLIKEISPEGMVTDAEFSEFLIANQKVGYAGTCDGFIWLDTGNPYVCEKLEDAGYANLYAKPGIPVIAMVDFKSRGANTMKPLVYETDTLQLAAYQHALPTTPGLEFKANPENMPVANILVNTHQDAGSKNEKGDIRWDAELVIHKKEDLIKAWDAFQLAHGLWCWLKNYYPQNASVKTKQTTT